MRVLIAVSLWHAPIPWVHSHDLEGPQVDRLEVLSQHVAEFHASDLGQAENRLNWHFHLVLPWCLVHHFPCPDNEDRGAGSDEFVASMKMGAASQASGKVLGEPTVRAFLNAAGGLAHSTLLLGSAGPSLAIAARTRGTHFFETYGRSASVRDLVGVRLC